MNFRQRLRGAEDNVPGLLHGMTQLDVILHFAVIVALVQQKGDPQRTRSAFCAGLNAPRAPRPLRAEQTGLLQLPQGGLPRFVVHAEFRCQSVFAGDGIAPAPAQDFRAQVRSDLIGDGEEGGRFHAAIY